ncbi:MAG: hypothetical protein QM795_05560 [Pseudoxanthomonas sp.]
MRIEKLSILDTIKGGDIQASMFTTFNANLKFYEDLVLRRLTAAGCRNNVLLMDQRQCALAHASVATRPSFAGVGYTLVPIATTGAFHPKICLLAGKKSASIFVGSHNLTISGFGYNREVTSFSRLQGKPGAPERNALAHAWAVVRRWIESADLPVALRESAYQLDKEFGTTFDEALDTGQRLLAQHVGTAGLLDQLADLAPAQVERITLIGAFFDSEGRFVDELLRRWPNAMIVVGIEPATVWLSRLPKSPRLKIVDASALAERDGYLHAKAIHLEGSSGRALFASGSANPSVPAWMTDVEAVNTEAMLVRFDADARQCASALGLSTLAKLPSLSEQALGEVVTRSRKEIQALQPEAISLHVGIANHENALISLDVVKLPAFDCIVACDNLDRPLESLTLDWSEPANLRVTGDLRLVRSLMLRHGGVSTARVLVHHPELIARQIRSSAQEPTADLLRALGSEMEDISRVIPALEKVIFADSVANAVRVPGRAAASRPADEPTPRPDTLCVPLDETRKKSTPSLFTSSHDLAYLIEILTRSIDVGVQTQARGLDHAGRTEEEQIGQDDEGEAPDFDLPQTRPSDADIGDVVCRKMKGLFGKMAKVIRNAEAASPQATASIVVQLVAVMALVQELSRLENSDRWRTAHIALFWNEDLEPLVDVALDHLFVSETGVHALCNEETAEEVFHLIGQLLWAAWLLGIEWWTPSGSSLETSEQEERALSNTRLIRLLEMADNNGVWAGIASQIERTLPADPLELRNARRWLGKHERISKLIGALSRDSNSAPPGGTFHQVTSLMSLRRLIDYW